MSGHNKWSKIKRQKGVNDLKKAKVFSKLSKMITIAAKNGGDIETNPSLKILVDSARQVNMPSDNINKAIKKGTGEISGGSIEEVLFEAYGPEGVALIIEATTDNNNRTVSEVKHILSLNGGRLGEGGSVKWMFDRFGYIEISNDSKTNKEELELAAIEGGADDINFVDSVPVIYTKPEDLYRVKDYLEKEGFVISEIGFEWKAKNKLTVSDDISEKIEKLFNALDDQDDVNDVYSNLE